jgi:YggT family protein
MSMVYALLTTLSWILGFIWLVFLVMIIMSWLIGFNVVNTRNQFVAGLWRILNQITEPILKPIRRIIPPVGGLDLSPIVVFVAIFFLQQWITSISMGRVI